MSHGLTVFHEGGYGESPYHPFEPDRRSGPSCIGAALLPGDRLREWSGSIDTRGWIGQDETQAVPGTALEAVHNRTVVSYVGWRFATL